MRLFRTEPAHTGGGVVLFTSKRVRTALACAGNDARMKGEVAQRPLLHSANDSAEHWVEKKFKAYMKDIVQGEYECKPHTNAGPRSIHPSNRQQ